MVKKVLLHACCAICSGYPIEALREIGYEPVVYFYNPNIYPKEEYEKRLVAQKKLCEKYNVELIVGEYNPEDFYDFVKGFENEPEKGKRCDLCFKLRFKKAAEISKSLGIDVFTTSMIISPHKDFKKLSEVGMDIAKEFGLEYLAIDFKKKDGFLKTNRISKELNLYRQNYCGCKFSLRK